MTDSNTITQNGDTNGQYAVTDNDNTLHVVFQFLNVPVTRRMNPEDTNAGGYAASEMREYLVQQDKEGSGRFLAGLIDAGVPEGVLWAPKRIVSVKEASGSNVISDLLWLPTERELFGEKTYSVSADETAGNQARLEYYDYDSSSKLIKYLGDSNAWYWEASPSSAAGASSFCHVNYNGTANNGASGVGGCAPAFCVH